jgi:hypothetical protein
VSQLLYKLRPVIMNRKQSRSTGVRQHLIKFSKIDLMRNAYDSKFTLVKGIFFPITLSPNQHSNKDRCM